MNGVSGILKGVLVAAFLAAATVSAEERGDVGYTPTPENLAARTWFQDAKFGMFVHWGVYCLMAKGEWVMNNDKISIAEYEKLPPTFNPSKFDPDEWCRMVRTRG